MFLIRLRLITRTSCAINLSLSSTQFSRPIPPLVSPLDFDLQRGFSFRRHPGNLKRKLAFHVHLSVKKRSCANTTESFGEAVIAWCSLWKRFIDDVISSHVFCEWSMTFTRDPHNCTHTHETTAQTHVLEKSWQKQFSPISVNIFVHTFLKNTTKKKKENHRKQHSALINHFLSFSTTSPLKMKSQTACMILKKFSRFQFSLPFFSCFSSFWWQKP